MSKTVLFLLVSLLVAAVFMSNASASAASLQETGGKPSAGSNPATSNKSKKKVAPTRRAPKAQPPKEAWDPPMTVVLVRSSAPGCEPLCPEWLAAEGRITPNTPAVFRRTLQKLGKRWLPVVIQSPGGDVQAAMDIGRMVRKAGLPVGVGWTQFVGCEPSDRSCKLPKDQDAYRGMVMINGSFCNSACPLILAGGTERLAGPKASFGLHVIRREWIKEKILYRETLQTVKGKQNLVRKEVGRKVVGSYYKEGIDKEYRQKISAYLRGMGVSPKYLDEMAKADYSAPNFLPQQRMRDLNLVTSEGSIDIFVSADVCRSAMPFRNCQFRARPAPAPAEAMTVVLMRATGCKWLCAEWIAASGVMTPKTPSRFESVLAQLNGRKLPVIVSSSGGDFDAALDIGRMIRKSGLAVAVAETASIGCDVQDEACRNATPAGTPHKGMVLHHGTCERECLLVLAAGNPRYSAYVSGTFLPAPGSFFTRAKDASARQLLTAYLADMGISPDVASGKAPMIPKEDDHVVLGFETSRTTPQALVSNDVCAWARPPSYCVARDEPYSPPPPEPKAAARSASSASSRPDPAATVGKIASVYRIRSKGGCEPSCPEWIAIEGIIDRKTPDRFRLVIEGMQGVKLPIFLNSPGGDLDAALEIGSLIRANGLITAIGETRFDDCGPGRTCSKFRPVSVPLSGHVAATGTCDRECLFVLAAGVERWGAAAFSTLVPPPKTLVTRRPGTSAVDVLGPYLRQMGVSTAVLTPAGGGSPERPVRLNDAERRKLRFGTQAALPTDLVRIASCGTASPLPNCVYRAARTVPPPTQDAVVARMRWVARCEPSCAEWIMLRGTITADTPRRLAAVLEAVGPKSLPIMLDSHGGDLAAALEIGRMIRARGLDTAVAGSSPLDCDPGEDACRAGWGDAFPNNAFITRGRCDAECLLVLLGGELRYMEDRDVVMIPSRQAFPSQQDGSKAMEDITLYLAEVRALSGLVKLFTARPETTVRVLGHGDAQRYGLINTIESPRSIVRPDRCQQLPLARNCVMHFRPTGL